MNNIIHDNDKINSDEGENNTVDNRDVSEDQVLDKYAEIAEALAQRHAEETAQRVSLEVAAEAAADAAASHLILSHTDPMEAARELIKRNCTRDGVVVLKYWRGTFYQWNCTYYLALEDDGVRRGVWKFSDSASIRVKDKKTKDSFVPGLRSANIQCDQRYWCARGQRWYQRRY